MRISANTLNLARQAALNNEHAFHVAAILKRNKSVIRIGANSTQTNPKFGRPYKNGHYGYHLHAEMNVLRFARQGDEITVLRFNSRGELTMGKPCHLCEKFLREVGFKEVTYSDWNGELQVEKYK